MGEAKRKRELWSECLRLADSGTDEEIFARLDLECRSGASEVKPLLFTLTTRAERLGGMYLQGTDAGRLARRALRLLDDYSKQRSMREETR